MAYTASADWPARNINLGIATLLDAQLPADSFTANQNSGANLTASTGASYDLVEPNKTLLQEMLANEKMLNDGLSWLGIIKTNDLSLTNLHDQLTALSAIVDKEEAGKSLTDDDRSLIKNLVSQTMIQPAQQKSITYTFVNGSAPTANLTMSLAGLKFLVAVEAQDGKNLLAVGPIFNYQETQ